MNELERVELRVPALEPFDQDENPFTFAERMVKGRVRPDAIGWSIVYVDLHVVVTDVTRYGDLLPRQAMTGGEWRITYEVAFPNYGEEGS